MAIHSKENITHIVDFNLIEFNHEEIGIYCTGTAATNSLIAYVTKAIKEAMPDIVDTARKRYKADNKPALH